MTRVLIAVDDTDTSLAAADTAYRLFGDTAEYTVINVAENSPVEWGDDSLRYGTVYPLSIPGAGVVGGVPLVVRSSSSSDLDSDRVDIVEQTADDIAHEAGLPNAQAVGAPATPLKRSSSQQPLTRPMSSCWVRTSEDGSSGWSARPCPTT